jgi:hypothetical protein
MLTSSRMTVLASPVDSSIAWSDARFAASLAAAPQDSPGYSSVIDDALTDNAVRTYRDKLRQIALHPVKLHAGQSAPPNGGIGRFARPQIPELIGGGLVGINL